MLGGAAVSVHAQDWDHHDHGWHHGWHGDHRDWHGDRMDRDWHHRYYHAPGYAYAAPAPGYYAYANPPPVYYGPPNGGVTLGVTIP